MKPKTVAMVSAGSAVTDTTPSELFWPREQRIAVVDEPDQSETDGARNSPRVIRVTRDRMKIRTVRGEY